MSKELPPSLKVGTGWIELEIIFEPDVVLTFKGYTLFYEEGFLLGNDMLLYL